MLNALLLIVLMISVITDLKSRKIYNKVIFPSLLLAFLLNGLLFSWSGLLNSLLGLLTGFGILLIPYLMGGMGAGDVKLLALVGTIKGASFVFITAIYMGVIGGVIGLFVFLFRKGILHRLKMLSYSLCGIRYGMKIGIDQDGLHATFPYGVAIAGGALLTYLFTSIGVLSL